MNRFIVTLLLMAAVTFAGANKFRSGELFIKLPSQFTLDKSKPGNYTGTFTAFDLYSEELNQDWNETLNDWISISKEITIYDTLAGTITVIEQDTVDGQLTNADKYVVYAELNLQDSVFKINRSEFYSWTGTDWVMQGRTVYTYDGNNYLLSVTTEFQLTPGTFLAVMRTTYTNNSNGNPLLALSESYNMATQQWANSSKSEYTYQAGNPDYQESETEYDWNEGAWEPYYKTLYTRNAQLNATEIIYQDYFSGSFQNSSREVITYLADGERRDSNYYYVWMDMTSSWQPSSVEITTYNAAGDDDVIYYKTWIGSSWENLSKITFTYDAQQRETVELTEIWENNAYRNAYRILSSYTATSVKEETAPASFTLKNNYPNPFNPSTTIEYEVKNAGMVTLTVYNVLGQIVAVLQNGYQQAGVYTVQFDASGLTSGVYLYELAAGNTKVTKKMILNK